MLYPVTHYWNKSTLSNSCPAPGLLGPFLCIMSTEILLSELSDACDGSGGTCPTDAQTHNLTLAMLLQLEAMASLIVLHMTFQSDHR